MLHLSVSRAKVTNLDKEETASPEFRRRQTMMMSTLNLQRVKTDKSVFLTETEEDYKTDH